MKRSIARLSVIAGLLFSLCLGNPRPASALTVNERYVYRLFNDFLLRQPTSTEVANYSALLSAGASRASLVDSFVNGATFKNNYVAGIYDLYLDRDPTTAELSSSVNSIGSNGFLVPEVNVLASSSFFQLAGSTNSGFVTRLYERVLRRAPDPSGQSFYTNQLNGGTKTRSQVATSMLRGSESSALRVAGPASMTECASTELLDSDSLTSGSYCLVLDRMADPSGKSFWASQLQASGQLPDIWRSHAVSNEYYNGSVDFGPDEG